MKPIIKNGIKLNNIKPNFALGNAYRIALTKLVKKMMADVIPEVIEEYKRHRESITEIVGDSLVDDIYNKINIRLGRWRILFQSIAPQLADRFVTDTNQHVNYQFIKGLEPLQKPMERNFNEFKIELDLKTKRLALAKEASIRENVNLITNIPQKVQEQIQQAIMASITRGRDVTYIKDELNKIEGMTKTRAAFIARDQNSKVTSVLNHAKMADIGIKKAIWEHNPSAHPRKSHVAANGKEYDIDKGCLIDGEYIYCGQLPNCHCTCSAILPFGL